MGGLSLTGSYTFAHALDNGSDPLRPGAGGRVCRAIRSTWPTSMATLTRMCGNVHGRSHPRSADRARPAYLSSGFLGRALEGMQISGIQQAQTGLPFELRGTVDNLHVGVNEPAAACWKPNRPIGDRRLPGEVLSPDRR